MTPKNKTPKCHEIPWLYLPPTKKTRYDVGNQNQTYRDLVNLFIGSVYVNKKPVPKYVYLKGVIYPKKRSSSTR